MPTAIRDRIVGDDAALVEAALRGGPEAFGPIVRRYQSAVFGVALARAGDFHDAEDVAQQVFLEAFQKLPGLRDPAGLGGWLRTIAIHRSLDALRRKPDERFAERVYELLCRYRNPISELDWPFTDIVEELNRIGLQGMAGYEQAMASSHAQTRQFACRLIREVFKLPDATDAAKETVIRLLKAAVNDKSKRVRAMAILKLMVLEVPTERVEKEFVPLLVERLFDPVPKVCRRAAWELQNWAPSVPLDRAALALAEAKPAARGPLGDLVKRIVDARAR